MTAFELSEKKVRFINAYNKYFDLEPDCNGKIIDSSFMSYLKKPYKFLGINNLRLY